jgi:hypothetical protein
MALNLGQQISTPAQPNLGTPTPAYDQGFMATSFGGLNAYFTKLTAIFAALFGQRGGKYINAPYGAFQDAANDYVEIMWRTSDVGVSIEHYAASSSPTRPAVPSVIATLSFVSNLSVETA